MEKSSFFNSVNGDRKYQASDFAAYFSKFIGNGVFPNPSTNLQVIANNDMTVTVKAGPGWINGYMYLNDSDLILPIEVADGVLNRIDRIALRMDTAGRAINAVIKKGTFASSPVAPTLQRDADGYELGVADVYVGAGVTSISQANITDKRYDSSLCGISSGLIQQVDVSTLFNQYSEGFQSKEVDFENEFNTWFDTIKNQLSGDVAGNLQNQINTLNDTVTSHEADYAIDEGTANAYKITLTPAPTQYEIGKIYKFKATNTNTGASTFQIGSLTATAIKKNVTQDLIGGDVPVNAMICVTYDGTNFQLLSIKDTLSSLLTASGDIIYASGANTPARLAKGIDGQALVLSGGVPVWGSAGAKAVSGSYTGDGTTGKYFDVGFIPEFVYIIQSSSSTHQAIITTAIDGNADDNVVNLSPSSVTVQVNTNGSAVAIKNNGFISRGTTFNANGAIYKYFVIG